MFRPRLISVTDAPGSNRSRATRAVLRSLGCHPGPRSRWESQRNRRSTPQGHFRSSIQEAVSSEAQAPKARRQTSFPHGSSDKAFAAATSPTPASTLAPAPAAAPGTAPATTPHGQCMACIWTTAIVFAIQLTFKLSSLALIWAHSHARSGVRSSFEREGQHTPTRAPRPRPCR